MVLATREHSAAKVVSVGRFAERRNALRNQRHWSENAADDLKMVLGSEYRDSLDAIAHLAYVLGCKKDDVSAGIHFSQACQGFARSGLQHWRFEHFASLNERINEEEGHQRAFNDFHFGVFCDGGP